MLSTAAIIIGVLAFVVFGFVAREVVKFGTNEEKNLIERRRAAGELASTIRETGQEDFADFVLDYSYGDYLKLSEKIHGFATAVKAGGKAFLLKNADAIFKSVLNAKLNTQEGRAWISALLVDATPKPSAEPIKTIVQ